jgi:hypothetical protein
MGGDVAIGPFVGGGGGGASDHKVMIDGADATAGYLASKLVAGANVTLTINNVGGNETITIASAVFLDVMVKVDASDTTAGYLASKLTVDPSLLQTLFNPGGNEYISLSWPGVKAISGGSGKYTDLLSAFTAGQGIGITADLTSGGFVKIASYGSTHVDSSDALFLGDLASKIVAGTGIAITFIGSAISRQMQLSVSGYVPTGIANAMAFFDGSSNLSSNAALIVYGPDPFGRPQIWDYRTGGAGTVWYQGAWQSDGRPTNTEGDGAVFVGKSINGILSAGEGSYARIKKDRFGLATILPGVNSGNLFYLFRADADSSADGGGITMRDNTNVLTMQITRVTGKAWFKELHISSITGPRILSGAGTPEGAVVGSVGDVFLRTDGGVGTTEYVKSSGSVTNTGWSPLGAPSADVLVKVDASDTTADYLSPKITAGLNIVKTILLPAGNESVEVATTDTPRFNIVNMGDPTVDGSWRMSVSGTDLVFERRESGVWVQKGSITA